MSKGRGCLGGLLFLIVSGQLGCWGTAILLLVLAWAIYYLLPIAYDVFRILLAIGVLFGAGITIRNYALALYYNVKPEKVTP